MPAVVLFRTFGHQALAPLLTAASNQVAPRLGCHTRPEAMLAFASTLGWLISPLAHTLTIPMCHAASASGGSKSQGRDRPIPEEPGGQRTHSLSVGIALSTAEGKQSTRVCQWHAGAKWRPRVWRLFLRQSWLSVGGLAGSLRARFCGETAIMLNPR